MKSDLEKCMDNFIIQKLREETSAGLLDCKKALEQNNWDFDKAKEYLKSESWKRGKMITYARN